jgi:hypothetical protein
MAVLCYLFRCSDVEVRGAYNLFHEKCSTDLASHKASTSITDTLLVDLLAVYFEPDGHDMLQSLRATFPGPLDLSHLEDNCSQHLKLDAEKHLDKPSQPFTIYDGTTCVEFHKLLLAILTGYGKNLCELNSATNDHGRAVYSVSIFYFALLLQALTQSRAFRLHLAILNLGEHLRVPVVEHILEYQSFAAKHGLICHDVGKKRPKVKGKAQTESGGNREGETEDRRDETDQATAPDDENEDIEVDLATLYRRRIRKHVTHFGALQILESYCERRPALLPDFQVPVIAVRLQPCTLTWQGIDERFKELSLNEDARKIIAKAVQCADSIPTAVQIRKTFRTLLAGNTATPCTRLHCESVLGSLLKFQMEELQKAIPDDQLRDLILVRGSLVW